MMRFITIVATAIAALFMAGVTVVAAPTASATGNTGMTPVVPFGKQYNVVGATDTRGLTVTNLRPSNDAIPYQPAGRLWEATVTIEAIRGGVQPFPDDFNARAANGDNYRDLFQVAAPQAVNPAVLQQGMKETGK